MKAKEWLARGHEAENPIDAFNNLWIAFNNLFYPQNGGSEREKIKNYLTSNISDSVAHEILKKYNEEICYLIYQPVVDMRGNGRDTQVDIDSYRDSDKAIDKLKSIFMIVYQVRCNLIHGQKSPSRNRDVELCANSFGIVSDVVNNGT